MPTELSDEADAHRFLERLRWPGGAPDRCPHCGSGRGAWFLAPADGRARATSTGAPSARRRWKCRTCRRQFSVLTGSVLQGTRTDLLTVLAVFADQAGPMPPSADATADRLAVRAETVRHLMRRLDAAEQVVATGSAAPAP